ncbi:MAG: Nif3-like dinuclear metal center hexameric protein [Bacteroidota bacterium]
MAITIKTLTDYLETIAPSALQESYDNAGLIVGNENTPIKGVLLCLDSIEAIVEEAIALNCNLIIAHHPIIFQGLKRLNGKNYVERTVLKAIKHDIAIYAIHTNLDNVYYQGVNAKIAEKLQLVDTKILSPKPTAASVGLPESSVGSGMIGKLAAPMTERAFLQFIKDQMQVSCIKHTQLLGKPVEKVAVCGGAGGFLLKQAIRQGADIFITSDYKYHEFFDADGHLVIADIGHYESEQYTIELLHEIISQKFSNFALYCTNLDTNPVRYF